MTDVSISSRFKSSRLVVTIALLLYPGLAPYGGAPMGGLGPPKTGPHGQHPRTCRQCRVGQAPSGMPASGPLWGHPDGGAGASEDWSPQTRRYVPFVMFLTPSLAFLATCGLCNCRHSACSSMFHKEKEKYRDAETERQINAKMCLQMCMRYVRNHVHMLYPSALQNQFLHCRVKFFTTVTSNDFEWL